MSPAPSPGPRTLRPRKRVGGATPRDNGEDEGSDASSYSDTAATEQREVARLNGIAKRLKSNMMPIIVSQEEQDEEDYDEFMNDTGSGKGKGKAKQTKGGAAEDSEEEEDRGAEGDDEDGPEDLDEDGPDEDGPAAWQPPWDLRPGALSDADLEAARAARQNYHDDLEVIARRSGKKMSAIFKAVGDHTPNRRHMNPWNAHSMKFRKEHPKPSGSKSPQS